jgi:AraC family transcriptional activator of tynA and feaB
MTGIAVDEQFGYWHDLICRAFVPLTPIRKVQERGFPGVVETRELGEVVRARIVTRAQGTRHGSREVAETRGAYYFVNLQVAGDCLSRHAGVESVVSPGQFVIVDTTEPYYFDFEQDWEMLSYRVPKARLEARAGDVRELLGRAIPETGPGGVVSSVMRALWQSGDLPAAAESELEQCFESAVAATVAASRQVSADHARAPLRQAVMFYVQERLADPDLTVASVSRAFSISPRTLHNLFAGTEGSFAASVRDLRLGRAARLLSDPRSRQTVTEISRLAGFAEPTSFTRAFRRKFGRSPREFRAGLADGGERAQLR